MSHKRWVKKASGKKEPFSENKLRSSLARAGASRQAIDRVIARIKKEDREVYSTGRIFNHAYTVLKRDKKIVAMRYSLRRAVMELGPSGFPFEKFVGEIFRAQGYDVKVGVIIQGACVEHEVDIFAKKNHRHIIVECKFHNENGIRSDVKVALYVRARFEDLKKKCNTTVTHEDIHEGWLVTNTKLTSQAIEYGNCVGMKVIGWNYPKGGSLEDLIIASKVHPLTCLSTLSKKRKAALFENGVVLCRDIEKHVDVLHALGMGEKEIASVVEEARLVRDGGFEIDL